MSAFGSEAVIASDLVANGDYGVVFRLTALGAIGAIAAITRLKMIVMNRLRMFNKLTKRGKALSSWGRAMIKSPMNILLGLVWFLMSALSFPDRNQPIGLPFHRYLWLIWLTGGVVWLYRSLKPQTSVPARRRAKTVPSGRGYVAQVVLVVGVFLVAPLWWEFHEIGQPLWNSFLATFLVALLVGATTGVRYLQKNRIEVGEARFSSTDANPHHGA